MTSIRVFREGDVPGAVELFARVRPENGWAAADCEHYFHEVLFNNPWRDLDVPSWIAEADGRIVGFYVVLPRRMALNGRTLRAAVGCQIVVEPQPRFGLVALQLAKATLSGSQDLTLADGANERARLMWLGIGGATPPLYNLQWIRLLRPARFALGLFERGGAGRAASLAARPLAALADGLVARSTWNRCFETPLGLADVELDAGTMLEHLEWVAGAAALRPVYDGRSLAWILGEAARKNGLGTWRARAVHDRAGVIGWYCYYVRRGGVSEVVQIAARDGAFDAVLRHLFGDAWRQGAAAVRGRLDPRRVDDFSARHCWFRREGACVLVHTRHADVSDAFRRGDAALTRLEGEWCLRFVAA
jgi:hypothetical protein